MPKSSFIRGISRVAGFVKTSRQTPAVSILKGIGNGLLKIMLVTMGFLMATLTVRYRDGRREEGEEEEGYYHSLFSKADPTE